MSHPDLRDNDGDRWTWSNAEDGYTYPGCGVASSREEIERKWGPVTVMSTQVDFPMLRDCDGDVYIWNDENQSYFREGGSCTPYTRHNIERLWSPVTEISDNRPKLRDDDGDIWTWNAQNGSYTREGSSVQYTREEIERHYGPVVELSETVDVILPVIPDTVQKICSVNNGEVFTRSDDGWMNTNGVFYYLGEMLDQNSRGFTVVAQTEIEIAVEHLTERTRSWSDESKKHLQVIIQAAKNG